MTTLESTFGDQASAERKTSGLAIASLVCSLVCCLPFTTIPGVLLGIVAIATISGNPARKGIGLAVTGILLGVVFTGAQYGGYRVVKFYSEMVYSLPGEVLATGYGGDLAGFRASLHGPGAKTTDAETQAFLDQLEMRYGKYVGCRLDEVGMQNQQPAFGSPIVPFPYLIEFEQREVPAQIEIAFSDPAAGGFLKKLGKITVIDDDLGDLTYPPTATAPGGDPAPATTPPPPDASTQPADTTPATPPDVDEPPSEDGDASTQPDDG